MKKISILAVAAIAAAMVSCGNGTPKADIKTDIDTLSYAVGMAQTRGLKEYLVQRMGMDTAYIDDFVKGLNESVNAGDDKKKAAYYAGLQIGQQISQQMIKGLNYELFGEDSTQTVSLNNFMAGFVAATTGKGELMTLDSAAVLAETMMVTIKDKQINERYADNKVASEKFMAEIAKKEGIQTLGDGIYYEVITEGKGEIPADTDRVKVACLAQLVNVIAPIMTRNGGGVWRQTIFYPFMQASNFGRGTAIRPVISAPTYDCKAREGVKVMDAACVLSEDERTLTVFAVNRSSEPIELTGDLRV